MRIVRFAFMTVLLALAVNTLMWGQEMNGDERAVWRLEEAYWRYAKEQDIESYLALWDEDFVGWPRSSAAPRGKANIADWIPALRADPARVVDFELTREAIRSFGDVVATHYLAWYVFRDATTGEVLERRPVRITHTWRRQGDAWRIITGMSAPHLSAE